MAINWLAKQAKFAECSRSSLDKRIANGEKYRGRRIVDGFGASMVEPWYYYTVVECHSSATSDYLYNNCDGVEFERTSNKFDLKFTPDSVEFKHQPRDIIIELEVYNQQKQQCH